MESLFTSFLIAINPKNQLWNRGLSRCKRLDCEDWADEVSDTNFIKVSFTRRLKMLSRHLALICMFNWISTFFPLFNSYTHNLKVRYHHSEPDLNKFRARHYMQFLGFRYFFAILNIRDSAFPIPVIFGCICSFLVLFVTQHLFSYQRSFLGRISYLQFYMFFQNMTDKNQDISVKCSRKSNSFELSFHSLLQPTQLQRQLQEKAIKERISAGTKFMGKQWRKISECKWLL